jgi:hypothetical protein
MKSRTIKRALKAKLDAWANSITDEAIRKLARQNVIVAGGSIASMLTGEPVNDFDLYFETPDIAETVAKYYVEQFLALHPGREESAVGRTEGITVERAGDRVKIKVQSKGVASATEEPADYRFFEDPSIDVLKMDDYIDRAAGAKNAIDRPADEGKFEPIILTTNAITLTDKIQIVVRFCGTPAEVLATFDFAHCMNVYRATDDALILNPEALECLLVKELRYKGSKYPLCSVIRSRKFIRRGFTCHAGDYLKMLWQVAELNLNDMEVLEEQLTGVDAAYFVQLIAILRENKQRNPDLEVTHSYVAEIIDRLM